MQNEMIKKFDAYTPISMKTVSENVDSIQLHSIQKAAKDYGQKMMLVMGPQENERIRSLPAITTPEMQTGKINMYEGNYTTLLSPVSKIDAELVNEFQEKIKLRVATLAFENQKALFPSFKKEISLDDMIAATRTFILPTETPEKYNDSIKIKYGFGGEMVNGSWVRDETKFATMSSRTPIAVDANRKDLGLTPANASSLITPGSKCVCAIKLPFVFCTVKEKKPTIYLSLQLIYQKFTYLAERRGQEFDIDVSDILSTWDEEISME